MIKAAGKTGLGLPLLLLGLSGENVTRLAAGEPIRIRAQDVAALGLPQVEIVIHYGRTEGWRGTNLGGAAMTADAPSPGLLWHQAGGDSDRYLDLMRERGHLVRCECSCHDDGSGHCGKCKPRLPCGWPDRGAAENGP
jgi:hypothetical protein